MPRETIEKTFTFTVDELESIISSHLTNDMNEHGSFAEYEWQEDFELGAVIVTIKDENET